MTCESIRTGGLWSPEGRERESGVAAFYVAKYFVRYKKSITVLLRLDNSSSVSYVNKLVGTLSPGLNLQHCEGPLAMVHEERCNSDSGTPARCPEHNSRRGVLRSLV